MALKVAELVNGSDETLGEFLWRVAKEHVFTEASTDEVAKWLSSTLAALVPLPIPGKAMVIRRIIDSKLPELPLLATRELLQVVGLLDKDDRRHPIPGLETPNPFENPGTLPKPIE